MKKYFVFPLFIFLACNNSSTAMNKNEISKSTESKSSLQKKSEAPKTDSMPQTDSSRIIGADKDDHGCLVSAGYRWSQAKNKCVRLFEAGIRLQPTEKRENASDGFLVFSDDNTKAELFITDEKKPVLLVRTGNEGSYVWKKDIYELFAWKGYVVQKDGKAIYHAQ